MKFISFYTLVFFILLGCKSTEQSFVLPPCVNTKIKDIQKEPVQNPPAEVWKWESNNTSYYYINSPCCDQFNYLYDEKCEIVCAPDGGFTGKGDRKCPEFNSEVKRSLIWKDERK